MRPCSQHDLIESLFELGLSISYDRVMEIPTAMYVSNTLQKDCVS